MNSLRVLAFRFCFLAWTALVAFAAIPVLLGPAAWSIKFQRFWARSVFWILRVVAGVSYEVRGRSRIPDGPFLVAAKHQSAWDTIVFLLDLPEPVFVFKRELLRIPLYGWYCLRTGMVPVDRSGGGQALRRLIGAVRARLGDGRPVIIFPEGTRMKPGEHQGYQSGVAGIYRQLDVPVVPVALNSGLVWPKSGLVGTGFRIVLEYLDPIPPGLSKKEFMAELEGRIEPATNRLAAEGREQIGQR